MIGKVGVYIGAFDPIHSGHLNFAIEAISKTDLTHVYFLVEPRPKNTQGVKAFDHRLNMAVIAIKDVPSLGVVAFKDEGATFDEAIPILAARFGANHLSIVITENSLKQIIKWPWLKMGGHTFHLSVGIKKQTESEVKGQIQLLREITGSKINVKTFSLIGDMPATSRVKASLKKGNCPSNLPGQVFEYIKEKRLYVSDARA